MQPVDHGGAETSCLSLCSMDQPLISSDTAYNCMGSVGGVFRGIFLVGIWGVGLAVFFDSEVDLQTTHSRLKQY